MLANHSRCRCTLLPAIPPRDTGGPADIHYISTDCLASGQCPRQLNEWSSVVRCTFIPARHSAPGQRGAGRSNYTLDCIGYQFLLHFNFSCTTLFRARALSSVSPRAQGNRLRPMRLGGSPLRGCVSKGAVTKLRLDPKNKRTEVLLSSLRQSWIASVTKSSDNFTRV